MRWIVALVLSSVVIAQSLTLAPTAAAQRPVVPGSGVLIPEVGDDFEDTGWQYIPKNPKSTEDIDEDQRQPTGKATNGRWYEGIKRGHPDLVRRVETPPDGLPGSQGAMVLQTMFSGIPGRASGEMHQDDFVCNVQYRMKRKIDISETPNVVTRVYLPPIDEWEKRNGPHFGFRLALETTAIKESEGGFLGFKTKGPENEVYWPGLFVCYENTKKTGGPTAYFRVRGDKRGGDFRGPDIDQTGWWTLGMSVTPDGMVHYYAHSGIEDLTSDDYITSQFPYGYQAERFRTFFFNVCSADDGKRWSTAFIVDDSHLYLARPSAQRQVAQQGTISKTRR
jgi:hypothetical protein